MSMLNYFIVPTIIRQGYINLLKEGNLYRMIWDILKSLPLHQRKSQIHLFWNSMQKMTGLLQGIVFIIPDILHVKTVNEFPHIFLLTVLFTGRDKPSISRELCLKNTKIYLK